MDRRDFIKVSGVAAAGLALTGCAPKTGSWSKKEQELYGAKKKGHFSLMQISSATRPASEQRISSVTERMLEIFLRGFEVVKPPAAVKYMRPQSMVSEKKWR